MKKSFVKLLIISATALLPLSNIMNTGIKTLSIENQSTDTISEKLNVRFFIHEGDIIVAKVIIPEINKYNFTSAEVSDPSISIDIVDGQVELYNLKPETTYENISIKLTDSSNKTYTFKLNNFKTPNQVTKSLDVKVSSYKDNFSGEVVLPTYIYPMSANISSNDLLIDVSDGTVTILELKPNTTYSHLTLTILDDQNNQHLFNLNEFTTVNKNFSYVDTKLSKNENNIQGKVLLPNDLIIKDAKLSDTNLSFVINKETNELILSNLKENEEYKNVKLIVQDTDNKLHNFIINDFSTDIVNVDLVKLSSYIENAYATALNRSELDKSGFKYWFVQLSSFKISARDFILNLLNTEEFLQVAQSSIDKITKIYSVMYNRTPDNEGLNFWIKEYEENLKITNDEKQSVTNIVTRMIGESEFKNLIESIGIKY